MNTVYPQILSSDLQCRRGNARLFEALPRVPVRAAGQKSGRWVRIPYTCLAGEVLYYVLSLVSTAVELLCADSDDGRIIHLLDYQNIQLYSRTSLLDRCKRVYLMCIPMC